MEHIVEKMTVAQLLNKPSFTEAEVLLRRPQELATGPYLEPP
jgi:hypothetical protein